MNEFTGAEQIIQWLDQTGLLDALTEMITDITVESVYAVLVLLVSAISSLAIGGIILAAMIISAIVTVVAILVCYVLRGIGLSRIAKKLGVKNRFLAWIPYGNAYLLGACAEQSMNRNGKKTWKWGLILLFTTLGMGIGQPVVQLALSIILSFLPGLSVLVNLVLELSSIILIAMIGHCLWSVCKEFMDNVPAIILAILGALGGKWALAVLLFVVGFCKLRPTKEQQEDVIPSEIINT